MKIVLATISMYILVENIKSNPLGLVLVDNKIYRGRLINKLFEAIKSIDGDKYSTLITLYSAMTLTFMYVNSTSLYIDIPIYTCMAWLYFTLQLIDVILIMNFILSSNTLIFKNSSIWFSKAKLLLEYAMFALGFVLVIIR